MKKKYWLGILPLGLLILIGLWAYHPKHPDREARYMQIGLLRDSIKTCLPEDASLAQKELRQVQKALARIKPKKPYIVIDTNANKLYLRTENAVIFEAICSTGTGGELIDSTTGRRWIFDTPRGVFQIDTKLKDPWWRKPDWAFIEENEEIPQDPKLRYDPEMLGEYALGFGKGYYIHGTIYERLLGINVTHGCVRLGSEDLKYLYKQVPIGTMVYIF